MPEEKIRSMIKQGNLLLCIILRTVYEKLKTFELFMLWIWFSTAIFLNLSRSNLY